MSDTQSGSRPRPAATVLLIREAPLEVLMVQRKAAATFSSAWVFPGGVVDPEDASEDWLPFLRGAEFLSVEERAHRIAALRELYEETGILQCNGGERGSLPGGFFERVKAQNTPLLLDALAWIGHWITPEGANKRFDTRFYVCRAVEDARPHADGEEIVAALWMQPQTMIARAEGGDRTIMFPTLANLRRLAETPTVDAALAAARAREHVTVTPRMETRESGRYVVIPADAGYAITEQRLD